MGATVCDLLNGKSENYIFPFFWQHGENEETLREYMRVIDESNCHAVCLESRPHPDFCGEKWWRDLDIILDEAEKRGMKVWILDDSHFPTGFANGAAEKAPNELRRQSVYTRVFSHKKGKTKFSCDVSKVMKKLPTTKMGSLWNLLVRNGRIKFDDDQILTISALIPGKAVPVELEYEISGKRLHARVPENAVKVYVTFLTRNCGIHRSYINMLDKASCRLQIDAVYEPHYAHYKDKFGTVIAGFFSDEPEIGNGVYFTDQVKIGNDFDMPWSRELAQELEKLWGAGYQKLLPLLWDRGNDTTLCAKLRMEYMEIVTNLVERDFSRQIGDWCAERDVEYIGHIIEDNNQHARLGASLGHYFRGLGGQHMAGIDDIGGQVLPQQEDAPAEGIFAIIGKRDGEFAHYMLGKLGASAAAIDPRKQGRCMCEIFGNYGWSEGPRLEKYLVDHFMAQGINRFVPHAFSPKAYPDKDCPPHFYAHGNNPQYRAFGQVMAYTNRVCNLISGGKPVVDTAVLYHAEAEWMGECMWDQKVSRKLMEAQVDFHLLPIDVFTRKLQYGTEITEVGLFVNGNCYHTLLIPYAQYISLDLAEAIDTLCKSGCKVVFVDALPAEIVNVGAFSEEQIKTSTLSEARRNILWNSITACPVVSLDQITTAVSKEICITPASCRMRTYHYRGAEELYFFVNEDSEEYSGVVELPYFEKGYFYDAWENTVYPAEPEQMENGTVRVALSLRPSESCILVMGDCEMKSQLPAFNKKQLASGQQLTFMGQWKQSQCRSIDYPNFTKEKQISTFTDVGKEDKKFSGYIRYENRLLVSEEEPVEGSRYVLAISDAGEDVEVFVNGVTLGIQVLPPFCFDITKQIRPGENEIRIEVATTLERERGVNQKKWQPIGITGDVKLIKLL
ncbi:MAG: glycosyl hydrolase [Ruminococcus sp.]